MMGSYNAREIEREIAELWNRKAIYESVKRKNAGGPKFYFCDGPPFATGTIHPGTAWNKCIKDAVCRYKRARGFAVRDQAGYDTHGLPIEVKVESALGLKSKKDIEEKIGVARFVHECKKFATQYIDVMSKQFKSLGVWMDFDHPYITYKDEYIERAWATFKAAHEKDLLHKGVYVLPYCPRCETTIANYELEYDEQDDPSVYAKFKVKGKENEFLIIWTTTPWTLVGNMAVMVHPTFQYVKAKIDEEVWIVAKERLSAVLAVTGELGKNAIVLDEFSGMAIKGLEYEHPLADEVPYHQGRKHIVVVSDQFVTLEEGTGLVHTAPGHGPQDFIVGKQYGIETFCPVGTNGKYTSEAGKFAGMDVRKANKEIIGLLREKGLLVHAGIVRHRYPHCWRCKTPLIYITTDQWFITITKVKDRMMEEIDACTWQPDFARRWFRDFVQSAPDWCISRQRYWGIPLPIWVCEKCGEIRVVGSKRELGREVKELHRPFVDEIRFECGKCGGEMRRVPDVLDVWFDSGNAVWAQLDREEEKRWYPTDFIVEGKDQIRGWFYSLLGSGIVYRNEIPYKSLLMHGFFVDEKGEKMSKSLGNFVPLEEMLAKYGADAFRLWSLGSVLWEDLKFKWEELAEAHRTLTIYWNLSVFLKRFYEGREKPVGYELEDQWLLARLCALVRKCTAAFESYAIHEATRACKEFIVEDLSRFYLKIAKKRIASGRNPEAALEALYKSMLTLTKLTTPIIPFISEAIYREVFAERERAESVSLLPWPTPEEPGADPTLEKNMHIVRNIIAAVANARSVADVKLRWPLEEVIVVSNSTEVRGAVERLAYLIEEIANVKRTRLEETVPKKIVAKPVHAALGPVFRKDAKVVAEAIEKLEAGEARKKLEAGETITVRAGGKEWAITRDMVIFEEKPPEGHTRAEFDGGEVYLNTKISRALFEEAMVREVARRIQLMRKELELVEKDEIVANVVAGKELLGILEKHRGALAREVKAKTLILSAKPELKAEGALKREWEIEEEAATIVVAKA